MSKKKIIASVVIVVICVCLFIKIYDTYSSYGLPEEKWHGIGDAVEYAGLEYTLKDVETCDMNDIAERFTIDVQQDALNTESTKKYFIATLDIKAVEEGYSFDLGQIGKYSKYMSGYSGEYSLMLQINDRSLEKNALAVGESMEYYMILSFSTSYYTEEGLAALGEEDIALVIYDYNNECINYMCKGDRLDTNID